MQISKLIGAVVFAAAGLSAASASALELRYNRWLPPTHHLDVRVLKPYFDKIAEVTDGRVTVEFTNSSLGSQERQYELAATGVADITFFSESTTPGQFPLAEVVEMPFLGDDTEAVSVAYWRTYEKFFKDTDPYKGTHLLTVASLPPYHIYNAKREVTAIDGFEGLKLRAAGVIANEKITALGATVVPAQITQFVELVSKGIVDGTYFTDDGIVAFGFLKNLKYKTEFKDGLGGFSISLAMNKAKWDQISPEDQAAIEEISGEALAKKFGESLNQSVSDAQKAMKEAGVTVTPADDAFMQAVRERIAPIEQGWIEQASKKGVDGAAALEFLRSEAASYTAQ
ncbi:MAG: TRAP transporter substrate-binding protein [Rhizobiaceae bacterium]|nr:TRAP transporter substrate-binding protein [Rhizobiaceae bacterium]